MSTITVSPVDGWIFRFNPCQPSFRLTLDGRNAVVSIPKLISPRELEEVRWYFEEYVDQDPFMETRAKNAVAILRRYGVALANTIIKSQLLRTSGPPYQLEINVEGPATSSNSIHSMPWELLEWPEVWPEDHSPDLVSVSRSLTPVVSPASAAQVAVSDYRRILLVGARPQLQNDVPYRLVSRALFEVIEEANSAMEGSRNVPITLDIVRPGTLDALKRYLDGKAAFDLVHLDMHGVLHRKRPHLAFIDTELLSPDLVSGERVATLLIDAGVRSVIMNACNSATNAPASVNIAATFIQLGMSEVIAMSYKVTADAVEIFTKSMYQALLLERRPTLHAVQAARQSLLNSNLRTTRFGRLVEAMDFGIPVYYRAPRVACSLRRGLPRQLSSLSRDPIHIGGVTFGDETPSLLIGRENDILLLESALLLKKNVATLVGPAGIGKTTLLKHLNSWWKKTSFVDHTCYILLSSGDYTNPENLLEEISQQLYGVSRISSSEPSASWTFPTADRYLVILDGLDSMKMGRHESHRFRGAFKRFVSAFQPGRHFLVLSSRKPELWLSKFGVTQPVQGLDPAAGIQLATSLLHPTPHTRSTTSRTDSDYLKRIVNLLSGNPLAIRLVANHMVVSEQAPRECFDSLLAGDPLASCQDWIDTNEAAHSILELQQLIEEWDSPTPSEGPSATDTTSEPEATASTLDLPSTMLSLFWLTLQTDDLHVFFDYWLAERYPHDWLLSASALPTLHVALFYDLPRNTAVDDVVRSFISKVENSGFLSMIPTTGVAASTNETLQIHPLLPIVLRWHKSYQPELRRANERAFVAYFTFLSRDWPEVTRVIANDQTKAVDDIELNFINHLTAARLTHAIDLDSYPAYCTMHKLIPPVVHYGFLKDSHRLPLLIELANSYTGRLLAKVGDETRMIVQDVDTDSGPLAEPVDIDKASDIFWTRVLMKFEAVKLLLHLFAYHEYLNSLQKHDLERNIKSVALKKLAEELPYAPTAEEADRVQLYQKTIYSLVGYDPTVNEPQAAWPPDGLRFGIVPPDEPATNPAPPGREHGSHGAMALGRTSHQDMVPADTYRLRAKINQLIASGNVKLAEKTLKDSLRQEVTYGPNSPKTVSVLLELLGEVNCEQMLWSEASDNLRSAAYYEDSLGIELSRERLNVREGNFGLALEFAKNSQASAETFKALLIREADGSSTPESILAAFTSLAYSRLARRPDGPVSSVFLLVRAAKSAYCNVPNSLPKNGAFLRLILRICDLCRPELGYMARKYKHPRAIMNLNMNSIFFLKIKNALRWRWGRRRAVEDRNANLEDVLPDIERHLFSAPDAPLSEARFFRVEFEKERALFHFLYTVGEGLGSRLAGEEYPPAPWCPTDGFTQTDPPDYHFDTLGMLKLAGYMVDWDIEEESYIAPSLWKRTKMFWQIAVDIFWSSFYRSQAESFRRVVEIMARRAGNIEGADYIDTLADAELARIMNGASLPRRNTGSIEIM